MGIFVDENDTIFIADQHNYRIIQLRKNDTNEKIVAGGHDKGNTLCQLDEPTDLLVYEETDKLIICDRQNKRVLSWIYRNNTKHGSILINNIQCYGLAVDNIGRLYVSEKENHAVRRYRMGYQNGTLIAGGNGAGSNLTQLHDPTYIFVDQQQSVYVSDKNNHRVMKWCKDAKEGIVAAGGNQGHSLMQLNFPEGVFVDLQGTVYVADSHNYRVMRWYAGANEGSVVVGGNGNNDAPHQLNMPIGLSFDRHGNLYVTDKYNHRVQKFAIQQNILHNASQFSKLVVQIF